MIYMDIDYMQSYKDFTLNEENFPDFPEFVKELKDQDIRLIPIIDAGVKVEPGYDVYEEGVKNRYFCQREDGSDFVAAVWPGDTHFPDVLNKDARKWFGDKYRFLNERGQRACRRICKRYGRKDPYLEDAECTSQCCKQSGRLSEILP